MMKPYLKLLSFVKVNNSLSKLNEIFNQVNTLVKNFKVVNITISIKYKVNNIVIYLDQPELYQAFINSIKKLNPIPIIDGPNKAIKENSSTLKSRVNNSPILEYRVKILSGYSIVGRKTVEFGNKCTAGFWVRQQGLAYLTTAGHCAANGTLVPHESVRFYFIEPVTEKIKFFGNMTRFSIEPVDRGFILPSDGYSESPFIYSKGLKAPLFAIADFTRTPVSFAEGAILCRSGSVTGYSCGEVTSVKVKTVFFLIGYGKINYEDLTEVSKTRGEVGDSGSPVFSFSNPLNYGTGVNLFGMMVGGFQINNTILFLPLYKILNSDMNVITIQD
ncbi:hypothetical protein C2G38_2059585 [Gigaspora rosea]|uniref:Trypsin-like cysteine/serine peptidase domain-containing protein n=1 Tax=Gigaspora rosea TaxID=44941 RepID=A0A397W484_9GLOM|nr:hypothetical protein C2G38_2059585 [Gigaspora rosea]